LMLGSLVSQAISRRYAATNFYDAVLIQDGHNLEHVMPPRDLQSWQQLPISAIVNFQPVVARDLRPETLRALLDSHPYRYFPVARDGRLEGVLAREDAAAALARQTSPPLQPAVSCLPTQTIQQLQMLLIESVHGMVVALDKPGGAILGLVTLHDLLRAQVSLAKNSSEY